MQRRHWYKRQPPQFSESQNDSADNNQNNSDSLNGHSNNTHEKGNGCRQEQPLEEQLKNKCTVNKTEQQPQYFYAYGQPHHMIKKSNEKNHNAQDIFYPVPSFDEAVTVFQRANYSDSWPKEEGNPQNWENNPKQFNQEMTAKEISQMPPYVFSPAPFPYGCDLMQSYSQMQPVMPNPEMFKPFPMQSDAPPMRVYYWPPNTPNVWRPGGEPVFLKNVDVFAQLSVAEDCSDLPMDNMESLRFFYNLGIKYFRLGCLLCSPLPPNPDGPICEQDLEINQDNNVKKKDYCRKMNIPQKSYRTL